MHLMTFIKKHKICIFFMLLPFVIYTYHYMTYLRYKPDRADRRWYPVNMAEKFTKTIDYQTKKYAKYFKCFVLAYEYNFYEEKSKAIQAIFRNENNHNPFTLTDEAFYTDLIAGKPHFLLTIYQEGKLVLKKELYITTGLSRFYEKINGEKLYLYRSKGHFSPRVPACYYFAGDSHYTIELINNTPMPQYQGVRTFFGIGHIRSK